MSESVYVIRVSQDGGGHEGATPGPPALLGRNNDVAQRQHPLANRLGSANARSPPNQLQEQQLRRRVVPCSEQRYSASLVLGLGIVHLTLGVLSAGFAILALFIEQEANKYACGLWAGVMYMICGILGVLSYSRYITKLFFLF